MDINERIEIMKRVEEQREDPFDVIKRELKKLDGINDVICRNVPDNFNTIEVLIDGCDFDELKALNIIADNIYMGMVCVGDIKKQVHVAYDLYIEVAFSYINKTKLSFECSFSVDDVEVLFRDGVTFGQQLDHIVGNAIKAAFPDAYGIQTSISRMDDD